MAVTILSAQDLVKKLAQMRSNENYYCMYSSLYEGLVEDSRWMLLPIDDHMVHRGDGVFEALKVSAGKIYLFDEHMARLHSSAERLGIGLYKSLEHMKEIVFETWALAAKKSGQLPSQSQGILRLFLSRGPGNFSTNPYDTWGSQFYVIATKLSPLTAQSYEKGVRVGPSAIPVKASWLAQVKSCNYLPNVMLKKEALDQGLDFVVAFDPEGYLAEGSTENMVIVSKDGFLVKPGLNFILRGCTMIRAFELAAPLVQAGLLRGIESRNITEKDLTEAQEIMMLGTTLDVLPVTEYNGRPVGSGTPGSVAKALQKALVKDQG